MGLFSFVQDVGRKVGLFGGRAAAEAEQAKAAAATAAAAVKSAADDLARTRATEAALAADLRAAILSYVDIAELGVVVLGKRATVSGTARAQADQEKAVLVAGNTEGIAEVDDRLVVVVPEPPAVFRTVVAGDTLSKIAKEVYGNALLYNVIFEANRPMLEHPDRIYPGQSLRIPPLGAAQTHTVAKGETLGAIARHWYGDPKRYPEIAAANGITDPDRIQVGQVLRIPLG